MRTTLDAFGDLFFGNYGIQALASHINDAYWDFLIGISRNLLSLCVPSADLQGSGLWAVLLIFEMIRWSTLRVKFFAVERRGDTLLALTLGLWLCVVL